MKFANFLRNVPHARSSLNGSEKLRQKFTNFESCHGKSSEQKLRRWTSVTPCQAPTPIHTHRPKCLGDAPRLARTGARYSLMPNVIHSEQGTIRATAVVSSSYFMHVPQMLFSVCVSCVQRYRTFESGFSVFLPRHALGLGYPTHLYALLSFVDPQHELFICLSYFVTLTKQPVGLFARCYCPSVVPLRDCCSRLRRRNNVAHQRCLTPFYSAIAVFDALPVAASNNVTDFAAALTGAAVLRQFPGTSKRHVLPHRFYD